jgi:hypothetical protein
MATPQTSPVESTASAPRDLTALIPALHIVRASGLAIDPRKMLLGGIALILLAAGDWLFDSLPFGSNDTTIHAWQIRELDVVRRMLAFAGFTLQPQIELWLSWDAAAFSLLTPIRTLVEPARVLFQANNSWSSLAFAWTQLLWALVVWSLIGGALCRMNALQFATRKRIGVWAALKFSRRQLLGYLVAPLLPLSAVLILQGFNWLLGSLAALAPAVGDVALGIGWGLVLFSGFLMAMLVLGIATGWPLMIAAISTEDSDGFDGLSRVFGYLFDRPWHAALFVISSLPIFAVSRYVVAVLVGLTISLGADAVGRGNGTPVASSNFPYVLRFEVSRRHTGLIPIGPAGVVASEVESALIGTRFFQWPESTSETAVFGWTLIPALLYVGFGPSFFWSATTVSYFLLRQSDDGTPLNSVVDWPEKTDSDQTAESTTAPVEQASDDAS